MPWCNKAKTKQKCKWICCNFAVVFSNLSLVLLWFLSNTHAVSHQWSCSKPIWVEPVTEFICYINILLIDWKWQIIDWKCHWELLVFVLLHPFFDIFFFLLWKIQKSFIVLDKGTVLLSTGIEYMIFISQYIPKWIPLNTYILSHNIWQVYENVQN